MKKKWLIIIVIAACLLLLLGVGFYFRHPHNLDYDLGKSNFYDDRGRSNPYFDKNAVCGAELYWECPDWSKEEKGIDVNNYFSIINEPSKEAGCIEKLRNIPCSEILN